MNWLSKVLIFIFTTFGKKYSLGTITSGAWEIEKFSDGTFIANADWTANTVYTPYATLESTMRIAVSENIPLPALPTNMTLSKILSAGIKSVGTSTYVSLCVTWLSGFTTALYARAIFSKTDSNTVTLQGEKYTALIKGTWK